MILLLTHNEILGKLPYQVTDTEQLSLCLEKAYQGSDDLHVIASFVLSTIPKLPGIANPLSSGLCITDALLRKNSKKISLCYINDPQIQKQQQIAKTVAVMGDIIYGKMSVNDVKTWLLWHVIDTKWNDSIWGLHREEKDLIKILDRFKRDAHQTQ